jgi:antitoxin component YwqK of YwqJK toxin-antitoxin module
MVYNTTSKSNPYAFYACSNSKRNGKQACSYHYTRYDHLYEVILQDVRKQVKLAKIGDKEFREYLTNANQQRQKAKVKKMTKVRAKSNKRFAELDLIIKRLYEDNVLGKISDERFMILTKSYEKEQSDLKETLEALDEQLAEIEIQNLNSYQFTSLIKQYTEITELTAPLLKELVDKVVIHQSEMRNGQRKQEIDIYYRFIGTI